ncbi:GvpL/GvpF family gas vesicle protein [Dictyobacter aurantiacus]|uniref:Protein gvpL n=1 Tax=Dictyobacter aurantiacus TaxID=1936993 RepID=A0A401ZGN9_9CHLR|nr:GvpL/GvpF family gas vesicle protein [Dictyobacter aurantiacus]GCE06051.1 protein gvpL [Dictyobacter aurantiacus]
MKRREQMNNVPSTSNLLTNNHQEPPEQNANMVALLEQCSIEMQKVEQRLIEAQAQFDVARLRFQELQTALIKQYAAPPQVASTSSSQATLSEEAPAADAVYPASGLYAYGFVKRSPAHLDIVGIDHRSKVYPVKGNGLSVMVSEIDIGQFEEQVKNLYAAMTQSPGVLQNQDGAILQAHEHVIDTIMQHTTIVPLKFGTILRDEQAAQQLLEEQGEHFKELLNRFRGKVECGLKVYVDKRVVLQQMMRHDAERINAQEQSEPRSQGTAYLLARKKEEQLKEQVNNELMRIAEHIFYTFGQTAFDMKQNSLQPPKATGKKKEMILNAVYLVGQEQLSAFYEWSRGITEHYASLELELEFSGPWPPYNFM